jgi:tetratricopeptide (TPR) repeat protein
LDEILEKRPDGKAPGAFDATVQSTANFWRGRLAADLGDYALAIQAFVAARTPVDEHACDGLCALNSVFLELQADHLQRAGAPAQHIASEDALLQQYVVPFEQRHSGSCDFCRLFVDWLTTSGVVENPNPGSSRVAPPVDDIAVAAFLWDQVSGLGIEVGGKGNAVKCWKGKNEFEKACNILDLHLQRAKNRFIRVVLLLSLAENRKLLPETDEYKTEPLKSGALADAINAYKQAMAEDPFFAPWAQLGIAECLARMGKKNDAVKELDNIASTWPTYAAVVAETKTAIDKPEAVPGPPGPG